MTVAEWKRKKQAELSKPQVHKKISNTFIESTLHNKTVSALRIMYYLANVLKETNCKNELNTIVLDTKKMLEYTELTMTDVKNNFKKMQETSISFINNDDEYEEMISLLPRFKIHTGRNRKIELDIYSKIAQLIVDVTKKYSFINTKQLMKLKFKHSIRLLPVLEMIHQYKEPAIKQKKYTLQELNDMFDTKYAKFNDIERFVLLKAKEELDNNSTLTFEYEMNFEALGTGRSKIISVTIKPKSKNNYQSTIFSNFEEPQEAIQPTKASSEKQKEHIEAPTDDEITFALNECNLQPQEASVKFEQFIEWKKGKKGRRSFKKYLTDGIKNGW